MNTFTNMTMGDKERVQDLIADQKLAAATYNTFAGECVCEQLRNEFLNILKEEHSIQSELWTEANARGWYPVKQAPANEIAQAYTKFTTQG